MVSDGFRKCFPYAITTRDMNRSDTAGTNFARTPIHADNESKHIMIMKPTKIRAHDGDVCVTRNEIRYYAISLMRSAYISRASNANCTGNKFIRKNKVPPFNVLSSLASVLYIAHNNKKGESSDKIENWTFLAL